MHRTQSVEARRRSRLKKTQGSRLSVSAFRFVLILSRTVPPLPVKRIIPRYLDRLRERGEPPQAAGGRLRRTFAALFLRCALYSRFLFTSFSSNKLGDGALSTPHELHRNHTHTG
jgi:hypothetical protein